MNGRCSVNKLLQLMELIFCCVRYPLALSEGVFNGWMDGVIYPLLSYARWVIIDRPLP